MFKKLITLAVIFSVGIFAINAEISSVRAVVYNTSGTKFAVATNYEPFDNYWITSDIDIFDASSSSLLLTIDDYWKNIDEIILSMDFSPDGKKIAVGSSEGRIHIIDAVTGQQIFELEKQENPISTIKFSPDGIFLATGSVDRKINIWNVSNGKLIQTINVKIIGTLHSLSYSPDGSMIAAATGTGTLVGGVHVYNAKNGNFLYMPEDGENGRREWDDRGMYSVTFSKDGNILAAGTARGSVVLWEARTGKFIRDWSCETFSNTIDLGVILGLSDINGIVSVIISPDSKIIISGSINGMIELRNISDASKIGYTGDENERVYSLSFKNDGNIFIIGTEKGFQQIRIK